MRMRARRQGWSRIRRPCSGEQGFESAFLQRGVRCEPDFRGRVPSMAVADPRRAAVGEKVGDAFTWFATLFQTMITSSFAIVSIAFFIMRYWHAMVAWVDADLPRDSV